MSLDKKQVKEIAQLARLNISDSEAQQTTAELNNILNLMAELSEIDTDDVEPMAHPLDMSQRLREDAVKEIAQLARLNISDSEAQQTTAELNNILNLMAELSEIGTDNVEPMAHPLDMSQRLREDVVSETDLSDDFQAIAPKTGKQHFLVPTVIE